MATGSGRVERPDTLVVPLVVAGAPPDALRSRLIGLVEDVRAVEEAVAAIRLTEAGASARLALPEGLEVVVVRAAADTVDDVRAYAMAAGRACRRDRTVAVLPPLAQSRKAAEYVEGVAEGLVLGGYDFPGVAGLDGPEWDRLGSTASGSVSVVVPDELADAVRRGEILGHAANIARVLVDTPSSHLGPQRLARACAELGDRYGFEVQVHAQTKLERLGFGGLVGVGRSSVNPPVLVELRSGPTDQPHVALVGKGITFDAGGLSLKPTSGMLTMKADMSAAAAVLGAVMATARLAPDVPVRAYLACAENLPGPHALRIGDVITHHDGSTSEITDADCEGRLVLADAVSYAASQAPLQLVDIGTLTSSSGLGPDLWAGFGSDDVVAELLAAGAASGERGWAMPLWEPYRHGLASPVADQRNFDPDMTQPYGGILAALYLSRFAGEIPWGHVDLGLTVMRHSEDVYWSAGANGRGARTLARYLLARPASGSASSSASGTASRSVTS
ncbi:MAG: hypothetical protein QM747_05645 [Nocardioides sp.]